MDLIAERGIAAHYCGGGLATSPVRNSMTNSRSSRGKAVCLSDANIALRVIIYPFPGSKIKLVEELVWI